MKKLISVLFITLIVIVGCSPNTNKTAASDGKDFEYAEIISLSTVLIPSGKVVPVVNVIRDNKI